MTNRLFADEPFGEGAPDLVVDGRAASAIVDQALDSWRVVGKRVLVLLPDRTRTAPIPLMYRLLTDSLRRHGAALVTCVVALGTHRPLERRELELLVGVELDSRSIDANGVRVLNHAWRSESDLVACGEIEASTIARLSGGRMHRSVAVKCNSAVLHHDLAIVLGPVFPHEVVGFSGGNKYFFPGVSSPEMIDASHWLGALITSRSIIGVLGVTPVRAMIDLAASMLPIERRCLALVVRPGDPPLGGGRASSRPSAGGDAARLPEHDDVRLCGLYAGSCEAAWERAAQLSASVHVRRVDAPYARAVAVVPEMYEEIWTGAKGMYKLDPVVADGGEVIVFAPHIREFSAAHGSLLTRIGYHCRDYFLGQWDRFADVPGGVLAHSTHLRGDGSYDSAAGIESCRIAVTLATGISRERCAAMNLGYLDPETLDPAAMADSGTLVVPHAGETLYRLAGE